MSPASRTVSARQLELLQRIATGAIADSSEATSVYALRTRQLVTTSSPLAYRTAVVTDAGRRLLNGSDVVVARVEAVPLEPPGVDPALDPAELLARLRSGPMTITNPSSQARAEWRQALLTAQRSRLVPHGMRIAHRDRGDLVVWLQAVATASTDERTAVARVAVPDRLRKAHSLIAAVREEKAGRDGWLHTLGNAGMLHVRLHRSSRDRALRLVQGLVDECVQRGHVVKQISSHGCRGGLGVYVGGHGFEVAVVEETDRVPYEPSKTELARAARDTWHRIPVHESVPSGRLVLRTAHDTYSSKTLANDRKRWSAEDRLGDAIGKLEELGAAEERAAAVRREREERRIEEWHAARVVALTRYVKQARINALTEQVRQFQEARDITEFVAAVRSGGDLTAGTDEWLTWAQAHADSINPTNGVCLTPELNEPKPDELAPFMNGFNPYGPEQRSPYR